MRKILRKGYALALITALLAIVVMAMWAGAAVAADKMPSGPEKVLVGAGYGLSRACAAPILMVKEGLNFKKNGILAPFKGVGAAVADEATNVPRTAATMVTVGDGVNYNAPVGQFSPEAQKVADAVPAVAIPF